MYKKINLPSLLKTKINFQEIFERSKLNYDLSEKMDITEQDFKSMWNGNKK